MNTCSTCGVDNRDGARFCRACGAPLVPPAGMGRADDAVSGSGSAARGSASELETAIPRPETQVGSLFPGTLLQGRYEVLGLAVRQADRATYRAYDRRRCPACGAESPAGEPFCPTCGAELAGPATCLLHEWLTPPEPTEVEGDVTFESGGRTFSVTVEEPRLEEMAFAQGVRLAVGLCSEKGPDRVVNQDSLLALTLTSLYEGRATPALGLFAVADGMGGHQAGEIASRIAVQVLAQEVTSRVLMAELGGEVCLAETLADVLRESVEDANGQVFAAAQSSGDDMGSTLTAALVRDELAVIANVGDGRAYHWHAGMLRQVTTDHSVVERLVATGQITPEKASGHPQKGVLYRSLGDRAAVEVDIFSLTLAPGDRLLLCCDGVWRSLEGEGLEEAMLVESDPQRICDQVIRCALEAGADDNASVIVVAVTEL
jgi:serine/threonine protein phosphatase PrpC